MKVPTFIEDKKHTFVPKRLADAEYADAIQCLTVVCTDVCIIDRHNKLFYLAPRKSKPFANKWWYIGGRSLFGERENYSIQRCFKRETGLLINKDRFELIQMNRYLLVDREFEPCNIGTDSLCYTFVIELTDQERSQLVLDKDEYTNGKDLKSFDRKELAESKDVPPPILELYDKVFWLNGKLIRLILQNLINHLLSPFTFLTSMNPK